MSRGHQTTAWHDYRRMSHDGHMSSCDVIINLLSYVKRKSSVLAYITTLWYKFNTFVPKLFKKNK